MTKAQLKRALKAAGEPATNRAIADLFKLKSEQAVQQWKKLPPLRILQLEKLRPDLMAAK